MTPKQWFETMGSTSFIVIMVVLSVIFLVCLYVATTSSQHRMHHGELPFDRKTNLWGWAALIAGFGMVIWFALMWFVWNGHVVAKMGWYILFLFIIDFIVFCNILNKKGAQ
jgi:cell division protein FtsW (lipid II flippase)